MKKMLLLLTIIPYISFGQKFEISEQAGYSFIDEHYQKSISSNFQKNGFSNQFTCSYHPIKYISISIFYELNFWASKYYSFGFAPDFSTKYFYAGIDLKRAYLAPVNSSANSEIITYNSPFFSYGVHIGLKQKILKHLSVIEQIGYEMQTVNTTYTIKLLHFTDQFNEASNYFYLRAGISLWI